MATRPLLMSSGDGRLISPAQSFAVKRVMNTVGVNFPLPSSPSVESLERCIFYYYNKMKLILIITKWKWGIN